MKPFSKSSIAAFAVAAVVAMTVGRSGVASDQVFIVTANPLWTDTGIALATTDVVQICGATGAWKFEINIPFSGPDGSMFCIRLMEHIG